MPAQNTDKFLKVAPNTGWQLDSSGIPDSSVDNFGLVSASGLPVDTGVLITVDRVDSSGAKTPAKMERILGVIDENRMVSCIRGVGGTAQAHAGGAVVEIVISSENFNRYVDAMLVEHNQDGTLKTKFSYADDLGTADNYAITLPVAPSAYSEGMVVIFKAGNANTGASVLNVNELGDVDIKKADGSDLALGDILADQSILVVYDGTYFRLLSAGAKGSEVSTITSSATPSINTDTTEMFIISALAEAITSMTTNLSGTPSDGDKLRIRIKDDGTVRAITWGASFVSRLSSLPTTTVSGKYLYIGLMYNSISGTWDCVASGVEV